MVTTTLFHYCYMTPQKKLKCGKTRNLAAPKCKYKSSL